MASFSGPGNDGANGANGAHGAAGQAHNPPQAGAGNKGKDAECSTWGDEAPTNGGTGQVGAPGIPGGNGSPGGHGTSGSDAAIQTITATIFDGTITLNYRGGNGGAGGNGGNGGQGGPGQIGGAGGEGGEPLGGIARVRVHGLWPLLHRA